jgi:hypothetical protein
MKKKSKKMTEVILTVLGTAVVAVTFFVHEVKRDKVKELKEELAQVQAEALIRDDIGHLGEQVRIIRANAAARERAQPAVGNDSSLFTPFYALVSERQILRQTITQSLSNITLLTLSLEGSQKYASQIKELESEQKILAQKDEAFKGQLFAGLYKSQLRQDISQQLNYVTRQDQEIEKEFKVFSDKHAQLVTDVTNDVARTTENVKASYECLTHVSYALYPVGFIIGLIGKLIGIEGVAEVE